MPFSSWIFFMSKLRDWFDESDDVRRHPHGRQGTLPNPGVPGEANCHGSAGLGMLEECVSDPTHPPVGRGIPRATEASVVSGRKVKVSCRYSVTFVSVWLQ